MRTEIITASILVVAAVVTARQWQEKAEGQSSEAVQQLADRESTPASVSKRSSYYAREVRIPVASNRQYYVEADVNRRNTRFLIDTGASFVALRESDARRAGIYPSAEDYQYAVSTANGKTRAARVTLDEIEINGLRTRDVESFILPDQQLDISLLGMSYLSRLSSVETRDGEMVLKQ